jgi:DNA-binding transcriptional LysR family regulator
VTPNGRLVVTFNEVGLAAAVAGLGLVSTTVGAAARKEISEGLVMRVLADWDMGEVELHAVFLARKAAKPSALAFVDLLASSTVMIFPSGSQLRSEFPRNQRAWPLLTRVRRLSE